MSKSCVDVIKIKESMTINDQQSEYNRCHHAKKEDRHFRARYEQFFTRTKQTLNNIVEELTKKIAKITQQLKSIQKEQSEQVMKCKLCGGPH